MKVDRKGVLLLRHEILHVDNLNGGRVLGAYFGICTISTV